jgi:AcrR family transcriptional regulator
MGKINRQSGDIRRSQIKLAVKEILFYEGLQKLTTKNIAKKVGISEGTVFKHFASKKEIINDILKDVQEDLTKPLRKIAFEKSSAAVRLEKYICFHLEYLDKNKGITILLFTEASYQNDTDLKKILDETYHSLEQNFGKIIRDGVDEGLWDATVSIKNFSSLYMGVPLAMSIELSLQQGYIKEENYCMSMLELLKRVLRKGPH